MISKIQRVSVLSSVATLAMALAISGPMASAAVISNVAESGGDNKASDTIVAQWTGQTFSVSVAGEPVPGLNIGDSYTVGTFGNASPAFVDRNHQYLDDPGTGGFPAFSIPGYLLGGDYIMSGNDNRDNVSYSLDVTINSPSRVFMLIDNRLQDGDNLTPPTFGPANMQWILDQAWLPTSGGLNRFAAPGVPDEVPIDEGADGGINQYYSVYYRDFAAGTFTLLQADNGGRNMYGVVVQAIPEPAAFPLSAMGVVALLGRRIRRR